LRLNACAFAFALVIAAGAFVVTLRLMDHDYARVPHLPDEASYIYQANLFAAGKVVGKPPPVPEAFEIWIPGFIYESSDHWATYYPFGHPLLMAPGVLFHKLWVMPSLVGAGGVFFMFLIGRRLFDARTGLLSAVLLATSPFFLMQSSNFMSHNSWTLYILASFFFLLSRQRPLIYGGLAGLFFGLALNTRTIEAVMLVPAWGVVLLAYIRPRRLSREAVFERREELKYFAAFLFGGALTILAMLGYNWSITGDPLTAPYVHQGTSVVLGFNTGFTFDVGLRNEQTLLMSLILVLNGWPAYVGLALVGLPFALGTRNKWDYFLLGCVLLVTGIYVAYRWSGLYEGPRYWYQAMPFLPLLSARGAESAVHLIGAAIVRLRTRFWNDARPARWAAVVVAYGLLALLVIDGTGGWLRGHNHAWNGDDVPGVPSDPSYIRSLYLADNSLNNLAAEQDLEQALVLVKPCGPFLSLACYDTVFIHNSVDWNGNIVWARYLANENAKTVEAFPGRRVYVATAANGISIVPWNPVTDP
jgi:hypothetical protein